MMAISTAVRVAIHSIAAAAVIWRVVAAVRSSFRSYVKFLLFIWEGDLLEDLVAQGQD
jgi:hypothetical protein